MRRAALGAAIVTTALMLLPRASAAQQKSRSASSAEPSEAVTLVYEGSASLGCPTYAEFRAEVSKLTSKARFTQHPGARRVRIELENRGSDVLGRLVTGEGSNQSSREVRGQDCREVSSALAIAVALTIDPEALGVGDPETSAEGAAQPPEPPPAAKVPAKPARPPVPPPQPKSRRLRWGAGAGLILQSAWAPQMRPGGQVFAMLGMGQHLRATLGMARFPTREHDDVSFGAWLGQGALSWNLALLGILRPFASVGFEAGQIEAAGTGLPTSVLAQRPWQAVSLGLGLRFETRDVFLQLGGSLLLPISRQRYLVSDSYQNVETLYQVPRAGLKQETSLGVFL